MSLNLAPNKTMRKEKKKKDVEKMNEPVTQPERATKEKSLIK